ncbi:hypothetical protein MKK67_21145 [Methylobacterium sp. J-072]|nr:hypothetical protein [Methylobacterium sp. J-072]MCJ2094987.1 hypothetical protein [Methylobacterium sp. J-072]
MRTWSGKSPARRKRIDIPRAVQHSDDDDFALVVLLVDRVKSLDYDAQPGRQLLARGAGLRKVPHGRTGGLNPRDQAICHGRRGVCRDIGPDRGQIGFRRLG